MSHPGPALARLALVLCVLAPESGARQSKAEVAVRDVLGTITRPAGVVRAIDDLALLGPAALAPLFESLCASEQGVAPLGKLQIVAIHGALERLPREAWLAVLARETRTGDDHRREAALGVLARLGGRGE